MIVATIACLSSAAGPPQTGLADRHGGGERRPVTQPRELADDDPGSPGQPPGNGPLGSTAPTAPQLPAARPGTGGADVLARIPAFPPAPPAVKIELPQGPTAAWLSRIPTTQKVAFITIDDGWTKQPEAISLIRAAHVPVTLFLTMNAIRSDPGYFKELQAAGAVIEAHTITHADLRGKSPDFQRREICGSADQLSAIYGRRPVLFRPPFGNKDPMTLQVTHECGMRAAFFWKETVDKGVVRFQEGHTVLPGDIILMHFRPAFADDFLAALQAIHDAGLTPALLEDYIP
ncbi:polysaccharide deacetylase family protein [Planosporangium flavigriseum]|nr:polysaccharide deacetylase family protein [Planosporangium flavigriseum]NJC63875.1 polysaccharide deacetylase family protein [Planosporangium flavigriseum]